MMRMSRTCRLRPGRVLDRAIRFFGAGGLNLERTTSGPTEVEFEGTDGYVAVSAFTDEVNPERSRVVVFTKGWEPEAHKFFADFNGSGQT